MKQMYICIRSCLLLSCLLAGNCAQDCDSFERNKICPTTVGNLRGEIRNVTDPGVCQQECGRVADCGYFTWVEFIHTLGLLPSCFLFASCSSYETCQAECKSSITGPASPAYPEVCCDAFSTGQVCAENFDNILDILSGVANVQLCQTFCQEEESCEYFLFQGSAQRCFLLTSCDSLFECADCTSGPVQPDIESCGSGNTTSTTTVAPLCQSAAVLIGGYLSGGLEVESWPCEVSLANVTVSNTTVEYHGAALLDGAIYICGGTLQQSCYINDGGDWTRGPTFNEDRFGLTLNRVGDTLVAIGGPDIAGYTVEVLRDGKYWELLPFVINPPRYLHCTATYSDTAVIIAGGFNNQRLDLFDIDSGDLVSLGILNQLRSSAACAMYQEEFWMVGGSISGAESLDTVESFSIENRVWTTHFPLRNARHSHTMAVINGDLTVLAGFRATDSVEIFNGTSWREDQLRMGRYAHAMVVLPCQN